jgi:hypothetical protein
MNDPTNNRPPWLAEIETQLAEMKTDHHHMDGAESRPFDMSCDDAACTDRNVPK